MAATRPLAADVAGCSRLILVRRIGLVENAQVGRSAIYRLKRASRHQAHELRRPGATLMLLWEEYRQREPNGYHYSRWCDQLRSQRCSRSVWSTPSNGP